MWTRGAFAVSLWCLLMCLSCGPQEEPVATPRESQSEALGACPSAPGLLCNLDRSSGRCVHTGKPGVLNSQGYPGGTTCHPSTPVAAHCKYPC